MIPGSSVHENLIHANYHAPRGRQRLYTLAGQLSQRYLYPSDLVVGVIGAEGAGKSILIKGLFPGLELTNDDNGVNVRPTPLFDFSPDDYFSGHTFHIDIRYESAFRQKHEIKSAINRAVEHNRRVIIEHFDLIFEMLGYNAQIIFGIGEEVIVCRPTVFGPFPSAIKKEVERTIAYRLMAHSAEDITELVMQEAFNYEPPALHSNVKHGFVLGFDRKPSFDLEWLESKVLEIIEQDLPIEQVDENHIRVGKYMMYCTGTRTHVRSSGMIENFRIRKQFEYDPIAKEYLLVGIVGRPEIDGVDELVPLFD